ncbi:MAG: hypothetical protein HYR55_02170 [Acidobacteria bacterium]|nr:hypothetical protein [Acidobacteriota bacterium]MBI3655403.1 hypothetical protein [Acidobacteriota bacterium]
MGWRTEWNAISNQIQGLLEAGRFYVSCLSTDNKDPHEIARREVLPQTDRMFESLRKFYEIYQANLPTPAAACLNRFLENKEKWDKISVHLVMQGLPAVQARLTALSSFGSEFTYQISDWSAVARRLSERAFLHLQRSIVADSSIRERWKSAFEEGELACEKLGGAHLLLHGIWAFKVNAERERTDLVLSNQLTDLSEVERTAEALVLTEWKIVREENEVGAKIKEAHRQAARYAFGALAGIELASYHYLVMVTERVLQMRGSWIEDGVTYQCINVAVDPKTPSGR